MQNFEEHQPPETGGACPYLINGTEKLQPAVDAAIDLLWSSSVRGEREPSSSIDGLVCGPNHVSSLKQNKTVHQLPPQDLIVTIST